MLAGALQDFVVGRTAPNAVLLRSEVVDVKEVNKGRVCLLVEAGGAGVVYGVVDCDEVVYVAAGLLCVKMKKERTKSVSAKVPARMVQRQSVHLRSFSSTGKLRNV
jgi:ClpP class serine protease